MNFEQDFEKKFNDYCEANQLMVVWYADLNHDKTTNNISEVVKFQFVSPYKSVTLPKTKLITLEYIIDRLEQKSIYNNLSKFLNKFFEYSGNVYPTSYGIGIFRFFSDIPKSSAKVETWLKENNIEYYNEYSDAGWVYRFKISKSQENIKKLQSLISTN